MRKRENQSLSSMMSLYLNYIFQKTTLIIFGVAIIVMAVVLFLLSNPWMEKSSYLAAPESFHQAYLQQALCITEIFNGILVATVILSLVLQSVSFDTLFISHVKRTFLCTAKLLAAGVLFLFLSLLEFLLIYGYPIFIYSEFTVEPECLLTIAILFASMMLSCTISMVLTTLLPSIFTPMVVLFLDVVKILVASSSAKLKEILGSFLIVVSVDKGVVSADALPVAPVLILVFILLYYCFYCIRDLRQA